MALALCSSPQCGGCGIQRKDSMMIVGYPYEKLGHADRSWLDARRHFSFARYWARRCLHCLLFDMTLKQATNSCELYWG